MAIRESSLGGNAALEARASCLKKDTKATYQRLPLVFIHIPRNAGSSVEMCSALDPDLPASQRWGCANKQFRGLVRMPPLRGRPAFGACYKQHVPPQLLPDIYANKETFCVVRDPYSRMVSQFKFLMIHSKRHQQSCTADVMNEVLLKDLTEVMGGNPYKSDCHYLPQTAFVYGIDNATAKPVFGGEGTRDCRHILRLENLRADFDGLMSSYGYPYTLLGSNRAGGTLGPKECNHLKAEDLSPNVRRLIEDLFAEDFQRLGYERMRSV